MDVGVGDGRDQPFDRHDEHVGLGHPDVVLDEQTPGNAGRGRSEAGMVELQRRGSMKAGHERGDELAVVVVDAVDGGTLEGLGGDLGLEPIERAVTVHHEQMQRIADRAVGRRRARST